MSEFTDQSIMAFGPHKGKHLKDVPNGYLLFLYENDRAGRYKKYIEDNLDVIKKVAQLEKNPPRRF